MEFLKEMIHDQDLPMYLRVEATRTTVYLHNKMPHQALGNKTPEELFIGKKLEVSHLRIFGCLLYIHVPKEKRLKLNPSRNKGIFLGYSDSSMGNLQNLHSRS